MKAISTLTETNAKLSKRVENQALELQKRQGKTGGKAGVAGSAETRGENEGKYSKNCKRVSWHLPDNCVELEKKGQAPVLLEIDFVTRWEK